MTDISTDVVAVRALTPPDTRFAAALHERALPHGFFGRLGLRFLAAYYDSFAASPHAVALVATVRGEPAGMLVGTVRNGAHYRWVLRNKGLRLAAIGVAALAVRPRELAFFLRTRLGRYLRGVASTARPHADEATEQAPRARHRAVLTHVAVDDAVRGAGAGAALVETFVATARSSGCAEACLVTKAGAAGAGDFYRRLGWTRTARRLDQDGRPIDEYALRL